jgi:hypothetical protein
MHWKLMQASLHCCKSTPEQYERRMTFPKSHLVGREEDSVLIAEQFDEVPTRYVIGATRSDGLVTFWTRVLSPLKPYGEPLFALTQYRQLLCGAAASVTARLHCIRKRHYVTCRIHSLYTIACLRLVAPACCLSACLQTCHFLSAAATH